MCVCVSVVEMLNLKFCVCVCVSVLICLFVEMYGNVYVVMWVIRGDISHT